MKQQRFSITWFMTLLITIPSIWSAIPLIQGLNKLPQDSTTHTPVAQKRIQSLITLVETTTAKLYEIRALHEAVTKKMRLLKGQMVEKISGLTQQFLNQKLTLLGQQRTALIEWEEVLQKTMRNFEAIITILKEQESALQQQTKQQPLLESAPTELKAITSFEDIIAAEQKVVETQAQINDAENNHILITEDLTQRKRAFNFTEEEYAQKRTDQEQFASDSLKSGRANSQIAGISPTHQGELVDLEERLAWYKQELANAKVQEKERAVEANEILIAHLKTQLGDFKKIFTRIKKNLCIPSEYVAEMEQKLNQKRQAAVAEREENNNKLRIIAKFESELQKKIETTQNTFDISPTELATIRSFNKTPQNNNEWLSTARLLNLFIDESLYRIEHEFLVAQSELDKAQLQRNELEVAIVRSWRRMTNKEAQFKSDEDVEQELKIYTVAKAEIEWQLATLIRSRDSAINSLHEFNVSFEKLRTLALELTRSQQTAFKDHSREYYELIKLFESIEEKIRRRFDWVSLLIEKYSTSITVLQSSIKKTEGIIRELISKGFWRRSESSLSWSDFATFLPDMGHFWNDLKNSAQQFFSSGISLTLQQESRKILDEPLRLLLLIVNLFLIITCYYIVKIYLPDIAAYISSIAPGYWIMHSACVAFAAFLAFINLHLQTVYWWSLLLILIRMHIIQNQFLAQLFYLVTIPYGLWLAYRMVQYWKNVNRDKRYLLVSEKNEWAFFTTITLMLSMLIMVLCTREAFLLGNYQHSRVPVILGAILFLSGQISVIALLGRSQILGLIGSDTPLWEWIYEQVNRYYYLVWCIVTATIVMFNPYIGYGKQVFYVIIRILLTASLISIASWIHNTVKHASVDLFFYYADRDVLKDRFTTARFWYTLFIILALLVFLTAVVYCGAHLWGFSLTLREMFSWLRYSFYTSSDEFGRAVAVTPLSIVHIAMYILGGFVVAYCVNTFIISRVLDPVIVESGVQNTVLTLVRYTIIITMAFMGLTSAGLDGLTTKLAILLAGIGFAVQDAVRDFFSYFILLVQRPVKVGDFIRVLDSLSDNENVSLMGFVRSITPRSIVIRKRNSTTVIIPNSRVVMNPIMNWSYTRGFFAFDDIRISVPYSNDPIQVRQLILDVLDKNPNILKNPAPIVRLEDFVDNGYSFLMRAFLTSNKIGEQWDIASDVRLSVVKALHEQGIEVASPVRTIRISKGSASLLAEAEPPMPPSDPAL